MSDSDESPSVKAQGRAWETSQESSEYSSSAVDTGDGRGGVDQTGIRQSPHNDVTSEITDSIIDAHDDIGVPEWREQDEIVISGIGGRLPRSENIQEFGERILNAEDLVSEDDSRWDPGYHGLPRRHAKLTHLTKFDAQFFGVSPRQANCMDPQVRILQEVAYEAMLDAGINPKCLRGRKVGVFVGCSASETQDFLSWDLENVEGYTLTGCQRSMFANRLSYGFDFRGPSFAVDTACSSSLLALQLAVDALRNGQCESALVCGSHLTLVPTTSLQFQRLGVLSPNGVCRSFDNNADGYVRSEGIVALFLQKMGTARRCYATVVHAKSNTDGFKEEGITFPGGDRQATLLDETYREAGIDPSKVIFVEAHGTGTMAGDPQEANAITDVMCQNRTPANPLYIGSVKSNMGHAEPASGMASVAKVLIAMESGFIPPSRNYEEPNQYIPALVDGRMKVPTEKIPWSGGLVGINSFGFGGSNTHVILRSFPRVPALHPPLTIQDENSAPLMLCYAGRTKEGMETVFEAMEQHIENPYLYKLLCEHSDLPVHQCPYRGYAIIDRYLNEEGVRKVTTNVQKVKAAERDRPVWFVYSGMGTQWPGMGKELMNLPLFKNTVRKCSEALRDLGVDPYSLIMAGEDESIFANTMHSLVCITAIQIALTEVLRTIGLSPDGIIGHSAGEMSCGYADGSMTIDQTMLMAYYRGSTILSSGLSANGGMAAVGLSWEDAHKLCPDYGVYPACHNGATSVTISGDLDKVEKMVADLKQKEVFAKVVNSAGVPFHTPMMARIQDELLARMQTAIPNPKPRSSKWLSTSNLEEDWDTDLAKYCSAEYHVHNVMSPVLFNEALKKIPEDAVTIEIAPHCVMQAILRRNLPSDCTNVGLMKAKQEQQLINFLQALGKIHQAGINIRIDELYPTVQYPVPPRTPMIAPLIKWDHAIDWPVINHRTQAVMATGGALPSSVKFSWDPFTADSKDAYVLDHAFSGKSVFPLTGHLVMAWKAACQLKNLDHEQTPFIIENVTVHRATFLQKPVDFDVILLPGDGLFNIMDGDQLALSGTITLLDEQDNQTPFVYQHLFDEIEDCLCEPQLPLNEQQIYQEFITRGYEYGESFRLLKGACGNHVCKADCLWSGNWVAFIDQLLQIALLQEKSPAILMPIRLKYLRIDPEKHRKSVTYLEDGTPMVKLRTDKSTGGCISGGIELFHVTPSIQRKIQHSVAPGRLSLEKMYFVPHHDDQCFEMFPALRAEIGAYKTVLRRYLKNGVLGRLNEELIERLPNREFVKASIAALRKEKDDTTSITDEVLENLAKQKDATLFQHLDKLFSTPGEGSSDEVNSLPATLSALEQDLLWGASSSQQRCMKVMIDILLENTTLNCKTLIVNAASADLLRRMFLMQTSHPLVIPRFTMLNDEESAAQLDRRMLDLLATKINYVQAESLHETLVDPLKDSFDCIILDKMLCRQDDIGRYLARLKELVKEYGFLIVNEITSDFDMAFYLHADALNPASEQRLPAPGDGSRHFGMYLDHEGWMRVFKENGFAVVAHQTDPTLISTLYMIRAEYKSPKEVIIMDVDDVNEFDWIEPLQKTINETQGQIDKKVWLVGNKIKDNGVNGLANCFRLENLSENRFRCLADVSISKKNRKNGEINFRVEDPYVQQLIKEDLHVNCYRDGVWGRFSPISLREEDQHAYGMTDAAFLTNTVRGDLSSIRWVQLAAKNYNEVSLEQMPNKTCGVLALVYYASLNFRDVMAATGRISGDDFYDSRWRTIFCPADKECVLGIEFAGRDYNTGERMMGICGAQALATMCLTKRVFTWPVPDWLSLEEAATLPLVYLTVYYAFFVRGHMRAGESVLIHGGAGAVGQAALNVALAHGCECFVTCGSEEKRRFLLERYPQLDAKRHISNSRSSEFEYHIMKQTKGKGVDMVLNSLAGKLLQASVRCLAQHGRFLEIGKYDMAVNSNLGMASLAKNISFHAIFLDQMMYDEVPDVLIPDWYITSKLFNDGVKSGVVKPLSRIVFGSDQAEEAFRYMGAAKHLGKVLVKIRDEETNVAPSARLLEVDRPVLQVRAVQRALCHPSHVYLITGGLGGFGLELANWLLMHGAKRVVLSSRSGPKNNYQRRWLNEWKKNEEELMYKVRVSTQPINTEEGCRKLIEECLEEGPLGGVFHLAMVLRDYLFEDQSVQNFKDAAEAKYKGTRNLDKITRELCGPELKWFAIFSSMSVRGNGGQTNYGWANCTMERIVEQRQYDQLPAVAIQWGAIGDVGVVVENLGDNYTMVNGTYPQRIHSCLQMLHHFLNCNHPIVASFVRADMSDGKKTNKRGSLIQSIARIIGVADVTQLDRDASLADLGLDSLMGVEIKQVLEREYELFLSPKDIRTLTLAKLETMAESDEGYAQPTEAADDVTTAVDEMDAVRLQMQSVMQQQFQLRLDVNDLSHFKRIILLNDAKEGKPVIFLHSIEGVATTGVRRLCERLPFPMYCIQWHPDVNTESMETMADDYIQVLRNNFPNGPYRLVGYSYGASLGIALATKLQKLYGVDAVEKLVLIDGSHGYMRAYRDVYEKILGTTITTNMMDNKLFEAELLCGIGSRMDIGISTDQLRTELLSRSNWEERRDRLVELVQTHGAKVTFDDADTLRHASDGIRLRLNCAEKYDPKEKFQGPAWLVRSEQEVKSIEIAADYGLGDIVTGEVTVRFVEGDHDTMVEGESSATTVKILTDIFESA